MRIRDWGSDVCSSDLLDALLGAADLVVDCTPKRVAAKNVGLYRKRGIKFILQGGEKHAATGHSFVADSNYASALDRGSTSVVSCKIGRASLGTECVRTCRHRWAQ